jgi:HSP20 family protein
MDDPYFRRWDSEETCRWCPAVDVSEDEKEILVQVDLPGVDPKDVDIQVKENVLTLRGERRGEKQEEGRNFHRVERSFGAFTRSFIVPTTVDGDKVSADYREGVLRVHLPKREEAQPRKVEIATS